VRSDFAGRLLDQLPLRRDGGIQILNRLVLMDHTHFKLVEAGGGGGGVCHGGGGSAGGVAWQQREGSKRVMTRQLWARNHSDAEHRIGGPRLLNRA
tara:strand:- start:2156 stop:2443 length:288 start_codon:yes stop_codon:yes gene_type:complete